MPPSRRADGSPRPQLKEVPARPSRGRVDPARGSGTATPSGRRRADLRSRYPLYPDVFRPVSDAGATGLLPAAPRGRRGRIGAEHRAAVLGANDVRRPRWRQAPSADTRGSIVIATELRQVSLLATEAPREGTVLSSDSPSCVSKDRVDRQPNRGIQPSCGGTTIWHASCKAQDV